MQTIDDKSRDYDFSDIRLDPRFERCEFEMKLTFGSWIVYALLSIGLSYGLSRGAAETMEYVFGMPKWFFWGECLTTLFFFIMVCFVSSKVFKNMELSD